MARTSPASRLGRSPYGERGLKLRRRIWQNMQRPSLSLRRAWIEIVMCPRQLTGERGRSPYGERGLKSVTVSSAILPDGLVALLTESVD